MEVFKIRLLWWLAQESPAAVPGIDLLGWATQYGPLGVLAAGLIVFAKTAYKRETDRSDRNEGEIARLNAELTAFKRESDRADRNEAEVTRLNAMMLERFIPLLSTAAAALQEANTLLRENQRERESLYVRERQINDRRDREQGER